MYRENSDILEARLHNLERDLESRLQRLVDDAGRAHIRRPLRAATVMFLPTAAAIFAALVGIAVLQSPILATKTGFLIFFASIGAFVVAALCGLVGLFSLGVVAGRVLAARRRAHVLTRRFALPPHDLNVHARVARIEALLGELEVEAEAWRLRQGGLIVE